MTLRFAAALILLAAFAAAWGAAPAPRVTTIERAEFLVSAAPRPPDDSAPWQPIALPDNWHVSRPNFHGVLWYRLRFNVAQAGLDTKSTHSLYSPRSGAVVLEFFVNGSPLASSRAYGDAQLTELKRPLIFTVPPMLLRTGENVLQIRATGNAEQRHGLSRLTIGSGLIVRPDYYQPRYDLQVTSIGMFGAALLCAALLALAVWWGARSDRVLLWFGATALAWVVSAYMLLWPPSFGPDGIWRILLFTMRYVYLTPLLVLCLRIGGARHLAGEAALWLVFLAGSLAAWQSSPEQYPSLLGAASMLYAALATMLFAWLLRISFRQNQRQFYFLALALLTVIGFTGHDWAVWMGFADFDGLLLAPFAMPFLILALGATIVERQMSAERALVRANAELEGRVVQKMQEADAIHRQVREALHEQAVLRERQRIMADMHDGLGSGLIGLLSQVRSRGADPAQIEQRLNDMLTDLRAIVDSLQPVEGDLGVVLGNIRYRMSNAIEASGVKFVWQAQPLPALEDLAPARVLSIQRIVLEALTNALRHAAASSVTVSAGLVRGGEAIGIRIADDGVGFDRETVERGHGLRNMRSRAQSIGVPIDIDSSPGHGTRVTLEIALTRGPSLPFAASGG